MNKIKLKKDLWYSDNKKGEILEVINFNKDGSCFVKIENSSMFVEKHEFELLKDEN